MDLVCSVHVLTITAGLSSSNEYVCSVYVEKMRIGDFQSPLLKKWHFLDLVCSVRVSAITTGFYYKNAVASKSEIFRTGYVQLIK